MVCPINVLQSQSFRKNRYGVLAELAALAALAALAELAALAALAARSNGATQKARLAGCRICKYF